MSKSGEITNLSLANNFNNPPSNIEEEKDFLNSFYSIADSLLTEKGIKPLVRKYIEFKAANSYNSALMRSTEKDLSKVKIEYYNSDFVFLFPSSLQNLVGILNIKSGIEPFTRRKNIEMIEAQVDLMEKTITNKKVIDRTIDYMLNSYISNYRDYDNFETNSKLFSLIANRISDSNLSSNTIESFAKLGYTVIGSLAPPIEMEDRNGSMISLDSFKGKTVVVDVWATWCVPCLKMLPRMKELEHEFEGEEIVFVGICMGSKKNEWLKKLEEHELSNVQLFDVDNKFSKSLNINAVPHILIYDKTGRLHTYRTDINQLEELLLSF